MTNRIDLAALWAWALGRPPTTAETLEVLVPLAHAVLAAAKDGLWPDSKFPVQPLLCTNHEHLGVRHTDGSEACWYDCVVESNNDHDFIPAVVLPVKDAS